MIGSNCFSVLFSVRLFNQDGIAINFDQYHDVCVAPLRSLWELAGLVQENCPMHIVDLGVDVTCLLSA